MTALLERIAREAKGLSREEREQLIANLVAELADEPLSEIDQAWIEEAERRFDELVTGNTQGIPAQEAIQSIRSEFGWKR